jgi:glycosyltransferase involved in cell wall biosynthesis
LASIGAISDLVSDRLPSELVGYGWRSFAGRTAEALGGDAFDLCWFDRPVSLLAARPLLGPTSICDLDDLEDVKLARRSALDPEPASLITRVRFRQRTAAWRRLQRMASRLADISVVCTDVDAERLRIDRVAVIPNAFPDPGQRPPPVMPRRHSVMLLGLHTYGPNADGAVWFIERVLPLLRRSIPDVDVSVVGQAGGRVRALCGASVSILGEVEDVTSLFASSELLAVPIRYGSGSRVKILEAWARAVPVVSTSIGAEGLRAANGVELVLGDGPEEFAEACARVLKDPELAGMLSRQGRLRYERHHTPNAFHAAVDVAIERARQARADQR